MSRVRRYIDDFSYIFREEGFLVAIWKTLKTVYGKIYLRVKRHRNKSDIDNSMYDVMFVNGCGPSVPHPTRYRVDHQMEQLRSAGYSVVRVEAPDFCRESLRHARTIIIFRTPITERIKDTILFAKKLNKRVIYDIDDLVIDKKYTDPIPFLATMTTEQKADYDDGVVRMGETLKMCDAAITTTDGLACELRNYCERVYINRNTASEEMFARSELELFKRDKLPFLPEKEVRFVDRKSRKASIKRLKDKEVNKTVTIGYFSGSITHNDDFELIKPSIVKVLKQFSNVRLLLTGEIDIPVDMAEFSDRIDFYPFCEWKRLPHLIAMCDINLAPLADSIFNRAKSENKWIEASLLKVPTIASNVGAFAKMIDDKNTGFLCTGIDDWNATLVQLIENSNLRDEVGEKAYEFCIAHCTTIKNCSNIASIIEAEKIKNVAFILPNLNQFGGTLVAFKHASILQNNGYDVTLIGYNDNKSWIKCGVSELPCLDRKVKFGHADNVSFNCDFDIGVATFWDTLDFLKRYPKVNAIKYLVQGYEIDFCEPGVELREHSSETYFSHFNNIEYLTISKWCARWLSNAYGHNVRYAPNGIDTNDFYYVERNFDDDKIRILIEGDCTSEQKNVDEAFRIVSHLDPDKFEIWYMTNTNKSKSFYRIDKMLGSVPHDEVSQIMRKCHVLIKTSRNESFSYPPLEMMATGGLVLLLKNFGNSEYVIDGKNCIVYEPGDDNGAALKLQKVLSNKLVREEIIKGGVQTAMRYDWNNIDQEIKGLYD